MTERIIHGDCLEAMRGLEADSIDATITDPPYGLSFMGKTWDSFKAGDIAMRRNPQMDAVNTGATRQGGRQRACADYQKRQRRDMAAFQEWCEGWAVECLRIAKPGTYLLAFGGTRTYHRMTCAIEDAGWEIHDCLCWLYGSGFPKHKSKLKPAYEPIVMARKPAPKATALNIDACRLSGDGLHEVTQGLSTRIYGNGEGLRKERGRYEVPSGRWPANVCVDEEAAAAIDAQSGEMRSTNAGSFQRELTSRGYPGGGVGQRRAKDHPPVDIEKPGYGETGGASRFFYCAKSSRREREAGLDGFAKSGRTFGHKRCAACGRQKVNVPGAECQCADPEWVDVAEHAPRANGHPTVKPVALMRWLVRLVTPPGGTVLDPFAGRAAPPASPPCSRTGALSVSITTMNMCR